MLAPSIAKAKAISRSDTRIIYRPTRKLDEMKAAQKNEGLEASKPSAPQEIAWLGLHFKSCGLDGFTVWQGRLGRRKGSFTNFEAFSDIFDHHWPADA